MLKAMNLVTSRPAPGCGDRRTWAVRAATLFVVPWKGRALFGTWESPDHAPPTIRRLTPARSTSFIAEINHAFPSLALTPRDVTLVHRGVVPAVVRADGRAALEGHEQVRDHADRGVEGLMTVAGTKYTTARAVAERVTNRIYSKLGQSPVPCRTAETPLPFVQRHGTDALLARPAQEEMVMTLEDAVVRRTPLGALGTRATRRWNTRRQSSATRWDGTHQTRRSEIDAVDRFYGTSNAWKT